MTEVQKERIKKWIAALRSGDYNQTDGALHDTRGYCCLGVACDLYIKEHDGVSWTPSTPSDILAFTEEDINSLEEQETLPPSVIAYYGLDSDDPEIPTPGRFTGIAHLSTLNDEGTPFTEIADLIERNLL